MRRSARPRDPARLTVVRLLAGLACLVGLFLMHGLGDHGTTATASPTSSASATMTMPAGGHLSTGGDTGDMGDVGGVGGAGDMGGMAGMGGMALCLAVLALAAMLWLARGLLRDRLGASGKRLARFVTSVPPSRPARPPDLTALSILRC